MDPVLEGFVLSSQQRRLLAALPTIGPFRGLVRLELAAQADGDGLLRALKAVADRHSILRTRFVRTAGMSRPLQVVDDRAVISVEEIDLGSVEPERRLAFLEGRDRPTLDLESGPVLAAVLASEADGKRLLDLHLPAHCADAQSLLLVAEALVRELGSAGPRIDAPEEEEPIQYVQFSEWQQTLLEGGELQEGIRFWRRAEVEDAVPELPLEKKPLTDAAFLPADRALRLPPDLSQMAEEVATGLGVSTRAVFLAAWQAFLGRLTGRWSCELLVASSGRIDEDLASMVGPSVEDLPCALEGRAELAFSDLAIAAERSLEELEEHHLAHGAAVVDEFGSRRPRLGFELLPDLGDVIPKPGTAAEARILHLESCRLELAMSLAVSPRSDGLELRLSFDPQRFEGQGVAGLLEALATLLEAALRAPISEVGNLPLVAAENQKSATTLLLPKAAADDEFPSWPSLFHRRVEEAPQRVAVRAADGELTYGELAERSRALATVLRQRRMGADKVVAVMLPPSLDLFVTLVGILESGAAYVPLDPEHPMERLLYLWADSRAQLLITHSSLADVLPVPSSRCLVLDEEERPTAVDAPTAPEPAAESLAYLIYTSGSTGTPKGVEISHGALAHYLEAARALYPTGGEGTLVASSVGFDLSITSIFLPLANGETAMLPERDGPEGLARAVAEAGDLSLLKLTPSHLRVLSAQLPDSAVEGTARALVLGGEAVFYEDLERWGQRLPEAAIYNEFGPTEATVGCAIERVTAGAGLRGPVPIGEPLGRSRLYVVDQGLAPVLSGMSGELYIAGPGLARGYRGKPAETAAAFLPDPFGAEGERMYRSGDRVSLGREGRLEFHGRWDDQVKIRGYRIEPGEVEAVLTGHPDVEQAAVVPRGSGTDLRLVAYVVVVEGSTLNEGALRGFLASRLPSYMVPARQVLLPEMPLAASGKIDREALPEPEASEEAEFGESGGPLSSEEEILIGVFSQVLGLSSVGRSANYFSLGGDSIRSIQVVALAQERGLEFSVDDLFQHPSAEQLATALQEQRTRGGELLSVPRWSLLQEADRARIGEGIEDAYPLTMLQAGMLFHRELAPDSPIYHDISSFHLVAPLDVARLVGAVEAMVARHATLRTRFALSGFDEPLQLVEETGVVHCPVIDLSTLPAQEQDAVIDRLFAAEKRSSFDPSRLPLIRFFLHLRGPDEWQLTLSFHHAILDGWSEATMIVEMFHQYLATVRGEPRELLPPAASFAAYVALEQEIVASREAEAYWHQTLEDSRFLRLPRMESGGLRAGRERDILIVEVPFADGASEGLKRLALSTAVPIKDVLLAVHVKALSVLCGEEDVLTCMVSAGRPEGPDGDRAVGLFINSMPFRLRLGSETWRDLVAATFARELEALPYRRYPLAALQNHQGGQAISETLFYFTHYHIYQSLSTIPDVEVRNALLYEETSFVIAANFRVDPFSSEVFFVLKCDGNQLTREEAEQIGQVYARVAEAMATEPGQPHARFDALSTSEREQVLGAWAGGGGGPEIETLVPVIERLAAEIAERPERIALVDGDLQISYGELWRRVETLAGSLRRVGVGAESRVGLCLEPSADLVIALLAILEAGGGYVPLDPEYPDDRLRFMVSDAGARWVVAGEGLDERFRQLGLDVQPLAEGLRAGGEAAPARRRSELEHLAYVIFTSGSTGAPKGSLITHRNLARLFAATEKDYAFGPGDIWSLFHSSSFDFSVWEMWGAFLYGGRLVVIPTDLRRDPGSFHQLLRQQRVSVLSQTPSAFRQLQKIDLEGEEKDLALRWVVFGGEPLDLASLASWFERHGDEHPRLVNMYGITETTVHVTFRPLAAADAVSGAASSIGRPLADLRVYILNPHGLPVPPGAPGEIYVGGGGVARGYLGRPGLTAERFVPDPFGSTGERLYRTGDAARFDTEGQLVHLGRLDQQVKVRGFRIELGEIEAVLSEHPEVQAVVVEPVLETTGDRRLVAYWVAAGEGANVTELRRALRAKLPAHMVPSAFVELDALPLTANGKVDRRALPRPESSRPDLSTQYVAPRTPEEEILAGIWAKTLGLQRVGAEDNFFELGGHSLTANQVIAAAREAFRVSLPLRALYEAETLGGLARRVVEARATATGDETEYQPLPSAVPDVEHRHDPFPLTQIQQAYWIGRQPGFELGDIPAHIYLEFDAEQLDLDRLARAAKTLIARHDMLRAVILEDGTQQILAEVPDYEIPVIDLRSRTLEEAEQVIEAERERMAHQKFDTTRWPLFELRVHLLPNGHIRLHFGVDLLITDADSLGILNRELGTLYLDPEAPLAPLDLSFRDYVLAEQELRASSIYERSKAYWLERLDDLAPAPELPLQGDLARLETGRFARLRGGLSLEAWERLKASAAQRGLTPSGVLMAAYCEILALWSKSPRFTINTTTYNCLPLHPHAAHLVGDFTSLTLVSVDSVQASFTERARAIQERFVEDMDHNHFTGIEVLRELSRRTHSRLQAAMPIVFTSTLPLHTREGDRRAPFPVELMAGITQSPQTLLDHQVSQELGALTVRWDYLAEAFRPGVVEAMFGAYTRLLQGLSEDSEIWDLESREALIPEAQIQARQVYNETPGPAPEGLLYSGFRRHAETSPERPAVFSDDRVLSFGEVQRRATALARELVERGLQVGEPVAVTMDKGWREVVAVLAVLEAGGAYVPVVASLPSARRQKIYQRIGARFVVVEEKRAADPEISAERTLLPLAEEDPGSTVGTPLPARQNADTLAYVIFTSGSTGEPKGVSINHRAALTTLDEMQRRFSLTPDDRVLGVSSLGFDLSVFDLFGVLGAGGAVVLPPADGNRDPETWLRSMQAHDITLWNSVPALMELLVEFAEGRDDQLPSSLRLVMMSGDWIPVSLPERIRGLGAEELEIVSLGGATEAAIWSIVFPIAEVDPEWQSIPYGYPLARQTFHVLNAHLEPAPEWVVGDLYIGGEGLADGYWGDPEQTSDRFITHPRTGQRLYRTGDLGRFRPEGWLEFLGRDDFQVKIQGHRIELGEIEAALGRHPQLRESVVMALGEPGGSRRLAAYVVASGETSEAATSTLPSKPILDPAEREAFKRRQPGIRRDLETREGTALPFAGTESEWAQSYLGRRSHLHFANRQISSETLAALLAPLAQMEIGGQPKYRYPSAGGVYAVQTYVAFTAGAVEGLEEGTYYYQPRAHRLVRLAESGDVSEELHWPANRAAAREAAFTLFLVADLEPMAVLYGAVSRDFCLVEAGAMAQLLEEEAGRLDLGLCQIGSLDFDRIRERFSLGGEQQALLHTLVGGPALPLEDTEAKRPASALAPLPVGDPGALVDELKSHLAEQLPAYMVPASFKILPSLPRTANGKLDRARLPRVEVSREAPEATDVEPRGETEATLAAALAAELGVEKVGARQNFFDLGATSLDLVRLHRRLTTDLGLELPVVEMFRHSTIEDLARRIDGATAGPSAVDEADRARRAREARRRRGRRAREGQRNG